MTWSATFPSNRWIRKEVRNESDGGLQGDRRDVRSGSKLLQARAGFVAPSRMGTVQAGAVRGRADPEQVPRADRRRHFGGHQVPLLLRVSHRSGEAERRNRRGDRGRGALRQVHGRVEHLHQRHAGRLRRVPQGGPCRLRPYPTQHEQGRVATPGARRPAGTPPRAFGTSSAAGYRSPGSSSGIPANRSSASVISAKDADWALPSRSHWRSPSTFSRWEMEMERGTWRRREWRMSSVTSTTSPSWREPSVTIALAKTRCAWLAVIPIAAWTILSRPPGVCSTFSPGVCASASRTWSSTWTEGAGSRRITASSWSSSGIFGSGVATISDFFV